MYIIFVKNIRNRIILSGSILTFWIAMIFISNIILSKNLVSNIKIENYITFSYPSKFVIENIFINNHFSKNEIETSSSFSKSLTQKFSNFKSLKGKFSFNYPSSFTLSQKDFDGSEIICHIDFYDAAKIAHGFVQAWNLPYELKSFLEQSKAISQQNYKMFNSKQMNINGLQAFHWEYTVLGSEGDLLRGNEVFLQKEGKMYRISFFVSEKQWNEKEKDTFWNMVSSLKIY